MITVWSKKKFDQIMSEAGLTADNVVDKVDHAAFISIISPDIPAESHYFERDTPNVLNLEFDDADEEIEKAYRHTMSPVHLFSIEDANKIIDFVQSNIGMDFYVHCTAGVSRSGAVGYFIRQMTNSNFEDFCIHNPQITPNGYILKILNEVYAERLQKESLAKERAEHCF